MVEEEEKTTGVVDLEGASEQGQWREEEEALIGEVEEEEGE